MFRAEAGSSRLQAVEKSDAEAAIRQGFFEFSLIFPVKPAKGDLRKALARLKRRLFNGEKYVICNGGFKENEA